LMRSLRVSTLPFDFLYAMYTSFERAGRRTSLVFDGVRDHIVALQWG